MAKITIGFGVVLILLGAWGFIGTGSEHPTALIPSGFGVLLVLLGGLANTEDAKRRMMSMHFAVTVALLGFLGPAIMAAIEYGRAHGGPLAHPEAVEDQLVMAAICLIFVALCVRSFIAARRERDLDELR